MIFTDGGGTLVLVEEEVLRTASRYIQHAPFAPEAGGILIGSYRGPHIDVTDCTAPMAADRRSLFMFVRNDRGHARAARKAWMKNGHSSTFVGEWHTHPEDDPSPSWIDRRSWRRLASKSRGEPLVFMIFGRKSVWCGLQANGGLIQLGKAQ